MFWPVVYTSLKYFSDTKTLAVSHQQSMTMTIYNAQIFDKASDVSDVLQTRNMFCLQGVGGKGCVKKIRAKDSHFQRLVQKTQRCNKSGDKRII